MSSSEPTLRQRWEYWGLSSAVWVIGKLPYPVLRHLADALGLLVWTLDRRGRKVAQANLEAAFDGKFSEQRRKEIIRASYQQFARTMLELFWAPNITSATLDRHVIEGLDDYQDGKQEESGRPTIFLCLHSSNFELLSLVLGNRVGPGMVVTQRLKNPLLGPIFDRLRSSTGHVVIPQERAMIRMFRHLRNGGYFCMLIDLTLDPAEASVIINQFDGLKTCVTQMHAALALRTGARIVPAECRVLPDGRYRLIYHKPLEYPPEASAAEIAQICWQVLESSLHAQPEGWLWSYKHWRFRPRKDGTGRYPFYANEAKRFDKLLADQLAVALALVLAFLFA